MADWKPWHGCHKLSEGCRHCYVYRADARYGRDASVVARTADFDLPLRRRRDRKWKLPPGEFVWTCFTSDFLVPDADAWRPAAWEMMRLRDDLTFLFITKRIDRLAECLPPDWGEGYPNVRICCTTENQAMADYRLPIFRALPIAHKSIVCEPLLGPVDLSPYLGDWVREVVAGGESGPEARPCDYDWVLALRAQCAEAGIPFWFKQTGANFVKNGRLYRVPRRFQHQQAAKAGISTRPERSTAAEMQFAAALHSAASGAQDAPEEEGGQGRA